MEENIKLMRLPIKNQGNPKIKRITVQTMGRDVTLAIILLFTWSLNGQQTCHPIISYGSTIGFDSLCTSHPYNGEFGNLVIPVKFHWSSSNTIADETKINLLLTLTNLQYNSNNIPIKFMNVETVDYHTSIELDYCQFDPNNGDCNCIPFGGSSYFATRNIAELHPDVLNIIVFDSLYFEDDLSAAPCIANNIDYNIYEGNAYYPSNEDPNGKNNYLIIDNDILNMADAVVLAHELGHLLGLYHTFETGVFDNHPVDRYDGIEGTGDENNFGYDDNSNNTISCNLMDYGGFGPPPLQGCAGILDIEECQKAKILDQLFSCRSNLCFQPPQPDVTLNNGLSVNYLNYENLNVFDTLNITIDANLGTNSGGFGYFQLMQNNQLITSAYAVEVDLNQLFLEESSRNGTYFLQIFDKSVYSDCQSEPVIVEIYFNNLNQNGNNNFPDAPCLNVVYADYEYQCGDNQLSVTVGEEIRFNGRNCGGTSSGPTITSNNGGGYGGGSSGPGNPGGGGGGGSTVTPGVDVPVINENDECQECVKELQRKIELLKNQQNGGN